MDRPSNVTYAELSDEELRELANAEKTLNQNFRQNNKSEQVYLLAVTPTDKTKNN